MHWSAFLKVIKNIGEDDEQGKLFGFYNFLIRLKNKLQKQKSKKKIDNTKSSRLRYIFSLLRGKAAQILTMEVLSRFS